MKKFVIKSLLFCLPILLPLLLFVIIDPFMLIGNNCGKIKLEKKYNIMLNRDFQTVELFEENYKKQQYHSFILGNSRSFFYDIDIWSKYVNATGNSFHFNCNGEILYGIERKLDYLNKKNVKIKNTLIVLDYYTLSKVKNLRKHLFIKHPLISGESYFTFYLEMFKGFFPKAIIPHLDLFLTGKRKDYMVKFGIAKNIWKLNPNTNQMRLFHYDSIIEKDASLYYKSRRKKFYKRDSLLHTSKKVINGVQKRLLSNIKKILISQNTNYKIIINPLYDQKKLNNEDLIYLNNLFGKSNVYDYSGKNEITDNYQNYYETSHYRPNVALKIMKEIYN